MPLLQGHARQHRGIAVHDDLIERRLAAAGFLDPAAEAAALGGAGAPEAWLRRREAGEPLAWITGTTTFCGLAVHVAPGVYVPRPQTEELARRAAALQPGTAVDLCTGSGAVAVALRAAGAQVVGVDVDPAAVACARANGIPAILADAAHVPLRDGTADVVTAVAPYVPTDQLAYLPADVTRWEPRLALDGGADGLDVVRQVVRAAARLLKPGGALLLELGGDQSVVVGGEPWFDEEGDLRGVLSRPAG